jgi:hypothetical protein
MKQTFSVFLILLVLTQVTFQRTVKKEKQSQPQSSGVNPASKNSKQDGKGENTLIINTALQKIGLPDLDSLKKMTECTQISLKALKDLISKPPKEPFDISRNECMQNNKKLSELCNKPDVLKTISTSGKVGGVISYACSQAAKVDIKYQLIKQRMDMLKLLKKQ